MSDEQQILEEAMYAAETGNANHWPIVASILADEITRLRAQLGEAEGQEPVGYGYFHKETAQMDGWLEITEADSEGHAWPDTHEPKPLYTHPAPAKVPEVNFDDVPVSVKELTPEAAWICGYYAYREAMLEAQGGE